MRTRLSITLAVAALAAAAPLAATAHADESQKLALTAVGSDTSIGKVSLTTVGSVLDMAVQVSNVAPKTQYWVLTGKLNSTCDGPLMPGSVKLAGGIVTGASGKGGLTKEFTGLQPGTHRGYSVVVATGSLNNYTVVGGAGHCYNDDIVFTSS